MKTTAACLVVLTMLCGAASAQDFNLPTPAKTPPWNPTVPEGEKSFYPVYMHSIPGARTWVQNLHADLWHFGTTQSVGDGAGMYIWLPAKGRSGFMCSVDTGVVRREKDGKVVQDDFRDFKGISLWIRGDGSDGTAVITTGYTGSKNRFRIPLKDAEWHKVFMPWEKWEEPITGPFWFITWGLERKDDSKANWYIVDRVHLYTEEKVEPVTPTPDVDPPGMIPARAFVSGREHLAKTLAKLGAKAPCRIVFAGDSIVAGAQIGYTQKVYTDRVTPYTWIYFAQLAPRLREHFGYPPAAVIYRNFDGKAKAWKDAFDPRPEGDLVLMSVATGGWKAQTGLDHLDEILREKPDCVVWEYGANDAVYGTLEKYVQATETAVDRLRAAGIEVVIQTITPSCQITPVNWLKGKSVQETNLLFSREARRIAKEKSCALADMEGAFIVRGVQFVGDLYSDGVHPNHYGHEMLADVLEALFTDRDVRIWRHGPAADKARK